MTSIPQVKWNDKRWHTHQSKDCPFELKEKITRFHLIYKQDHKFTNTKLQGVASVSEEKTSRLVDIQYVV